MKNSSNNSKKIPIIIGAVFLLIVAIAVAVFMSTGKPGETNKDVDLKGSTTANIEHKIEYGEDIKDKTFTVNTEKGEKEANFADLNPEVDTMIIGKTEHQLEIEKETFDVIVVVEDTKRPVMSGVEETIELKVENVEEVNVENELKELITAEDPIDGGLEVVFEVKKDEKVKNKYNVIATATDKNGNDIVEKFVVKVKQSKETLDNKENNEDDKETEKDSNEATGSSTDGTSSNTGSNNSANTGNSEGNKSSDSNKGTSSNTGSNANVNKGNQANSGGSANTAPKAQPKPQAPAQPKPQPKPEPKPQPKPQPKPEPKPTPPANDGLQKPANLPTGTSIIEQHLNSHLYSYQKNLSDGGKVNEIIVNKVTTSVVGIDRNGAEFTMSYNNSTKEYYYRMSNPSFSSESLSEVQGIAVAFSTAYGF